MTDQQYPEPSQATTALVLGIVGVILCGLLSPFAWWMGRKEVRAIDAGQRPPENRGNARIGQILGIIGTGILVLAIASAILAISLVNIARDDDGDIEEAGTLSVFDLEVGDCGDWPPNAEFYLSVTVYPCEETHDFEVYLLREMPDGAEADYPGEPAVTGFAEQECRNGFEDYVGIAWEDSPDLTYTYLYPNTESWEEGDREVTCTLTHVDDGTKLVGSKLGEG